jgi:hypothetical protein
MLVPGKPFQPNLGKVRSPNVEWSHRDLRNIDCLMALFGSVVLSMATAKEKEKEKKPINY